MKEDLGRDRRSAYCFETIGIGKQGYLTLLRYKGEEERCHQSVKRCWLYLLL